uniref:Uncharacterized protein n=1 Tax=Ditylenchus dipsaci TaxID=166011 RepID=A0A915D771_9BILA
MVSSSLQVNSCSPLPKQEYMEEEEEDDEEDDDQEEYEEDFEEGQTSPLVHQSINGFKQPQEQIKEEASSPSASKKNKALPKLHKNNRNTTAKQSSGVGCHSDALQLQNTIKEALKAAAYQRQRQNKASNSSRNANMAQPNQQQQLNGAISLMLQGRLSF